GGIATKHLSWIGCVSFESRCLGSLQTLSRFGAKLSSAFFIDYVGRVEPVSQAEQIRTANRIQLNEVATNLGARSTSIHTTHPYCEGDVLKLLMHAVEQAGQEETQLILDITCMTKVHTLLLCARLTSLIGKGRINIAYTIPENYAALAEER